MYVWVQSLCTQPSNLHVLAKKYLASILSLKIKQFCFEHVDTGQNANPDASSRPYPADSSRSHGRRREGRGEQGVRLHPERFPRRGRHVEVQKRRKAALHSHAGLSR